jgi:Cytochrome P450.
VRNSRLLIPQTFTFAYLTSDTTSTTLSHLWFHLASDKALVQRLQKEIDALKELNDDTLSKIDLLDATILRDP